MITKIQRKFLQQFLNGEISKEDNPKKYSEMMKAIQFQIDFNINQLLWIVESCPDILKDEKHEIEDVTIERYRRFRAFAYILTKLDPMVEFEELKLSDVLKKISQLYPKYYFEATRKDHETR